MARYRNKLVYDASTGEIEMTENICQCLKTFGYLVEKGAKGNRSFYIIWWSKSGEISDVQYFQKKLHQSLNVPMSRLESDNGFQSW